MARNLAPPGRVNVTLELSELRVVLLALENHGGQDDLIRYLENKRSAVAAQKRAKRDAGPGAVHSPAAT